MLIRFVLILLLSLSVNAYANVNTPEQAKADSSQIIKVAIFNAPPALIPKANGLHEGMLVDFLQEVAHREDWTIEWVHKDWTELMRLAKTSEVDLIPFIAYSKERSQFLDYNVVSFITGWGQVYIHEDDLLPENVLNFEDKTFAVVRDEIYASKFTNLCQQFEIRCNLIEVKEYEDVFKLLDSKAVDGAVSGNLVGYTYERQYRVQRSPILFDPNKVLFASPRNLEHTYLNTIDNYLQLWQGETDSPFHTIRNRWLGDSQSHSDLSPWVLYLSILFVSFLFLGTAVVLLLRKQVAKRTADLEDQSEQTNQIINLLPHLIYATNNNGDIILANRYAAEHFGISVADIRSENTRSLKDAFADSSSLFQGDEALFHKDSIPTQQEIETKNSQNQNITLKVSKVPFVSQNTQQPSLVTVGVDITSSKRYENQIQHMAHHDPLTGLPNRLLLQDRINQSLALAQRNNHSSAVFLIDLDYFKTINDSLGHRVGDQYLIELTRRLERLTQTGDTIARLGGDEFIVQLNDLGSTPEEVELAATKVAKKINQAISKPFVKNGNPIVCTASTGIVIYPADADTYELIMQRADTAMYQAKSMGRNGYSLFTDSMEQAVVRRLQLENSLREAIANNELTLHYQPQVPHDGKKLLGLEALLRWNSIEHGAISPVEFIPVAEESGIIIEIGSWAIKTACQQISYWLDKYESCPVITVNLSLNQVQDESITKFVKQCLKELSIPADYLELEVTESIFLNDAGNTVEVLNSLKKLGIRLSIDDFGTGYSSLSHLKKMPLDKLKIDRAFVKDVPGDSDSETITRTIIGMSQDMGLEVIAEGVETIEQIEFLRKENCHLFQGFYFSKAVMPNEIEEKYFTRVKKT